MKQSVHSNYDGQVCGTPGTSPLTLSPVSRRSLDTADPSSRCASSRV